ncbi:AAA family ATPase [Mitsuokella jalaludinii]|uniref:cytidylate kinase-like family protein n=2 Tax=Mitsuokella jalaludinii TaxID=187979 RepID=UPI001D0217D7|nr:cytidylate kinase-like family protein [Mitsuokella jalaludinii]MCB5725392.1 cytidylate kinase-like family protein [Mitsuokella jalaludinii]
MEKNTLVTITRQYGSGGREVADLVAKKMGVRRYDRKVVAMAAEKLGDEANFHDLIERSYNAPDNCLGNLGDYAYERVPQHNRMYIEQAKVILEVAKGDGSAVFLGRCADYILKDQPNTYSFFIYADDDYRLARAKTHYAGHTIKELDAEDKHREQYYAYYTGRTWGDPQNYDLMINTSKISLEAAADLIISYIELRQKKAAEA